MREEICTLLITWRAALYLDDERKRVVLQKLHSHSCESSDQVLSCQNAVLIVHFFFLQLLIVLQIHSMLSLTARCPEQRPSKLWWDFHVQPVQQAFFQEVWKIPSPWCYPLGCSWMLAVMLGRALLSGLQMPSVFKQFKAMLLFPAELLCLRAGWKAQAGTRGNMTIHFHLLSTLNN